MLCWYGILALIFLFCKLFLVTVRTTCTTVQVVSVKEKIKTGARFANYTITFLYS